MDSFENFQYESGSTYGGLPIVDDTSSIVSGFTNSNRLSEDLESLTLGLRMSGDPGSWVDNARKEIADEKAVARANAVDEELDGVLDDLKDESAVELPPHACRCATLIYI